MGTSVRPLPSSSSVVREQRGNNNTMAEFGLKKKEVEALDFAFDVYDFKGNGEVDAFYTGDLLRACNLNPTLKTIAEIGGEKEKGKRMLKLYDKNEDNTILSHQLYLLLTNLGEKLNKEEAKSLMKELCEPDDDDGFTPFIPFLEKMCAAES